MNPRTSYPSRTKRHVTVVKLVSKLFRRVLCLIGNIQLLSLAALKERILVNCCRHQILTLSLLLDFPRYPRLDIADMAQAELARLLRAVQSRPPLR